MVKKSRSELTVEDVRRLLHYDPETGIFTWRVRRGGTANAGTIAGSPDAEGYLRIKLFRTLHSAHWLAWFYVYGVWPKEELDHEDRVRTNNRLLNLREATQVQQTMNTGLRKDNTSGVKGVNRHSQSGRWHARIGIPGAKKSKSLGVHACFGRAVMSYRRAAEEFFGEFRPTLSKAV